MKICNLARAVSLVHHPGRHHCQGTGKLAISLVLL